MRRLLLFVLVGLLTLPHLSAFAQEELTETFTSADGSLTFQYPAGWTFTEDEFSSSVNGGNTDVQLESPADVQPGQVFVGVLQGTLEPGETLQTTLESFLSELVGTNETPEVTEADSTVSTTVTAEIEGVSLDFFVWLKDVGEANIVLLLAVTASGEMASHQETLNAMAESLVYTLPAEVEVAFPTPVTGEGNIVWQLQGAVEYSPDGGNFGTFRAVTASADDTLYIADATNDVLIVDSAGNVVGQVENDLFSLIDDLAVASDGTLWLAHSSNNRLYHVTPEGEVLASIGELGIDEGEFGFSSPKQVEIDAEGNVYVLDAIETEEGGNIARIQVFSPEGELVRSFNLNEANEPGFYDPVIEIAPDGLLYVAASRVYVYDLEGNRLNDNFITDETLPSYMSIYSLAVDAEGHVYIGTIDGLIYELDAEGVLVSQFGENMDEGVAFAPGQFNLVSGLVALSDGSLVAVDWNLEFTQALRFTMPE